MSRISRGSGGGTPAAIAAAAARRAPSGCRRAAAAAAIVALAAACASRASRAEAATAARGGGGGGGGGLGGDELRERHHRVLEGGEEGGVGDGVGRHLELADEAHVLLVQRAQPIVAPQHRHQLRRRHVLRVGRRGGGGGGRRGGDGVELAGARVASRRPRAELVVGGDGVPPRWPCAELGHGVAAADARRGFGRVCRRAAPRFAPAPLEAVSWQCAAAHRAAVPRWWCGCRRRLAWRRLARRCKTRRRQAAARRRGTAG